MKKTYLIIFIVFSLLFIFPNFAEVEYIKSISILNLQITEGQYEVYSNPELEESFIITNASKVDVLISFECDDSVSDKNITIELIVFDVNNNVLSSVIKETNCSLKRDSIRLNKIEEKILKLRLKATIPTVTEDYVKYSDYKNKLYFIDSSKLVGNLQINKYHVISKTPIFYKVTFPGKVQFYLIKEDDTKLLIEEKVFSIKIENNQYIFENQDNFSKILEFEDGFYKVEAIYIPLFSIKNQTIILEITKDTKPPEILSLEVTDDISFLGFYHNITSSYGNVIKDRNRARIRYSSLIKFRGVAKEMIKNATIEVITTDNQEKSELFFKFLDNYVDGKFNLNDDVLSWNLEEKVEIGGRINIVKTLFDFFKAIGLYSTSCNIDKESSKVFDCPMLSLKVVRNDETSENAIINYVILTVCDYNNNCQLTLLPYIAYENPEELEVIDVIQQPNHIFFESLKYGGVSGILSVVLRPKVMFEDMKIVSIVPEDISSNPEKQEMFKYFDVKFRKDKSPVKIFPGSEIPLLIYFNVFLRDTNIDYTKLPSNLNFNIFIILEGKILGSNNVKKTYRVAIPVSFSIETPLFNAKFLNPKNIDEWIRFINTSLQIINSTNNFVKETSKYALLGCAAFVGGSYLFQDADGLYWLMVGTCERLRCNYVPKECSALTIDQDTLKFKDEGGFDVEYKLFENCQKAKEVSPMVACDPSSSDPVMVKISKKQEVNGLYTITSVQAYLLTQDINQQNFDRICRLGLSKYIETLTDNNCKKDRLFITNKTCIEQNILEKTYTYSLSYGTITLFFITSSNNDCNQNDKLCCNISKLENAQSFEVVTAVPNPTVYKNSKYVFNAIGLDNLAPSTMDCYKATPPELHNLRCLLNLASGDKPIFVGSPSANSLSSIFCGCLPAIRGYLDVWRDYLKYAKDCLEGVKKGELRAGYCELISSIYACDFFLSLGSSVVDLFSKKAQIKGESPKTQQQITTLNPKDADKQRYNEIRAQYFGSFMNYLGLENIKHTICTFTMTGLFTGVWDFSMIESMLMEGIEKKMTLVEPQLGPVFGHYRMEMYDPLAKRIKLKYFVYPSAVAGNNMVNYEVYLVCDPSLEELSGECGGNYFELLVKTGTIPAGKSLQETWVFSDDDLFTLRTSSGINKPIERFLFNRIKVKYTYVDRYGANVEQIMNGTLSKRTSVEICEIKIFSGIDSVTGMSMTGGIDCANPFSDIRFGTDVSDGLILDSYKIVFYPDSENLERAKIGILDPLVVDFLFNIPFSTKTSSSFLVLKYKNSKNEEIGSMIYRFDKSQIGRLSRVNLDVVSIPLLIFYPYISQDIVNSLTYHKIFEFDKNWLSTNIGEGGESISIKRIRILDIKSSVGVECNDLGDSIVINLDCFNIQGHCSDNTDAKVKPDNSIFELFCEQNNNYISDFSIFIKKDDNCKEKFPANNPNICIKLNYSKNIEGDDWMSRTKFKEEKIINSEPNSFVIEYSMYYDLNENGQLDSSDLPIKIYHEGTKSEREIKGKIDVLRDKNKVNKNDFFVLYPKGEEKFKENESFQIILGVSSKMKLNISYVNSSTNDIEIKEIPIENPGIYILNFSEKIAKDIKKENSKIRINISVQDSTNQKFISLEIPLVSSIRGELEFINGRGDFLKKLVNIVHSSGFLISESVQRNNYEFNYINIESIS
ncbi:MAG: hypothetical protein QXR30_04085 [Candidatus Woesearchaeota archaeon]